MTYRTKTYMAGDWTGDRELIDQIYSWKDSNHWGLHFADAHELTHARDSSLCCSIKKSLAERLNASKTFVLIVGEDTIKLTKGSCQYCDQYYSWSHKCRHYYAVDYRSYIQYECEKAAKDNLKIVVIYNGYQVRRTKCPEAVRDKGKHITAYYVDSLGRSCWNYSGIKDAIMG